MAAQKSSVLMSGAAGHLLLHGAERAADGDGGQLARGVLGDVEVGGEGDAVAVVEGDFRVVHLVTLWENLVPLLGQCQLFFHIVLLFRLVTFCRSVLRAARTDEEGQAKGGDE